jgi:hypothetical protein
VAGYRRSGVLGAAFPADVDDPKGWPLCTRLLPHARVLLDLIGEEALEPQVTSWLLERVACYLQVRVEFVAAQPLFERALAIREKIREPEHLHTAMVRRNLEQLLAEMERKED